MQRLIIALTLFASAACVGSPRSHAVEPAARPTPAVIPVRTGHADVNLTGTWATGSAGEPADSRGVLQPQCNYNPAVWVIEQSADTVRAWAIPESYSKGTASTEAVSSAPVEGWVSGVDVTLGMPAPRYVLHYDSTSGHLRGTLDGAPFWAARVEIVRPERCLPVP